MATLINTNYFSPTQIGGCALWLDAADSASVIRTGVNVTAWNDKSGNARHMSNATLSTTPTYNPIGFNNLPTISFSPTIFNFLQNTSFNFNSVPSLTLFIIVQRISNTQAYQRFFSAATTIGGLDQSSTTAFNLNTSAANDGVLFERNGVYTTKATLNTLNPSMIELIINGTSTNIDLFLANNNYIYTNGSLGTSSTGSANGNNFNLVHVRLGNAATAVSLGVNEQLQGNISEVVMFSRTLNLNEFRQVEGYLAWKWNLQTNLPTTHPYFYNPMIPNLILSAPLANPLTTTNTTLVTLNPTQIGGCSLWLDAADSASVIRTGSAVTAWNDKSGNGKNVTATGTPTYVANSLGGLNAINFATSASYFTTPSFALSSNGSVTMFFIYNFVSAVVGNTDFFIGSVYTNFDILIETSRFDNLQVYLGGLSGASLNPKRGVPYIYTVNYNYNTNTLNIFANGSNVGSTTRNTNNLATPDIYRLGFNSSNAFYYESVIYNNSLTTSQQQQIEGYLAWKWGLQANLPTNHPYFYNPLIPNLILPSQVYSLAPSFSPSRFSGLSLWLDAADSASVVTSGSSVARWNDKSGSAINMVYDRGTLTYNSTGFNSKPTITFDTRSAFTYNSAFNLSTTPSLSIYIVLKPTASSGNTRILSFYNGNDYSPPGFNISLYNPTTTPNIGFQRGTPYAGYNTTNVSNINVFTSIIFNGNLSTNPAVPLSNTGVSVNGQGFTNFTGYSIGTNFSTYNPFQIGGWYTQPADIFTGNISEILVFNRAFTTAENQQIEGYLAWKWGLQSNLPANHPYVLYPPN